MGQTLDNGIYLPSEGERNCYEGLAGNWVALDNHLGSTNIHVTINDKQAWDGHVADTTIHVTSADKQTWNSHVADTTIHVTSADKQAWDGHVADSVKHVTAEDKAAWNGKADASALTAHTGDTTIHVTAADKQTWNGKQDALSQTQLDAVNSGIDSTKVQQIATNTSDISSLQSGKANDSNVVHKSGDETISGNKTWSGLNTFKQNITYERTNFYHQVANPSHILKDTELEKGSLATTHASYPGLWHDKNGNILGYVRFVEYSSGRQTAEFRISNLIKNGALDPTGSEVNCAVNLELQPSGEKSLIPEQNNDINLGTSTNKWKSINGLTPSSLGMPSDRSARVDISGYFTNMGNGGINRHTAVANGFIYLKVSNVVTMHMMSQGSNTLSNYADTKCRNSTGLLYGLFPVRKDDVFTCEWYTTATNVTLDKAYFIPCQGNI